MLGYIFSLNFWHNFWWIYSNEKYITNYSVYFSIIFHRNFISGNVQYFFTQIFVQINNWNFGLYKSKIWMANPENSDIQHRNKDVFISPEMSMTFFKCHRHFQAKFCWNKDTIGHIDRWRWIWLQTLVLWWWFTLRKVHSCVSYLVQEPWRRTFNFNGNLGFCVFFCK